MTSLKLDPSNIPKYCPHCQMNGIKSKVKKFRLEPTEPRVIMCINDKVRSKYFMTYLKNHPVSFAQVQSHQDIIFYLFKIYIRA